ncbi:MULTISPECIES: glycosyltransferase family 2 protein [Chryseobacterium]|uniref:Dolichol-phosphate mannosyltransferase n=1 Tax=Chryseobacterium geocarposphaerae TaxID=1416776 RepID=A0ABU1LF78_9FLAO|nr:MULTISPECIES: glycosyltransferase family 2 protein [Chryseobacterium]MDR6405354.1 dolichol-phosphate mannosyltransferase [Chryseobacterium geocarposphaerae]MDR6697513.1 dolichol-phosphate mannosyltransferase [Chryseobacterium ginsenosidimutans]
MISIVSPVYRAEKILPLLVSEISKLAQKIGQEYEIILVDDRSPDNSWEVMKLLTETNTNLKIYRLSRNFGQHATIMAGLSKASGEWIVVMDCDMQDQPKEIEKLYQKALEGYDVVLARREVRIDSFFKRSCSKIFYKVFNYFAGIEINNEIANFGIYNKKVIESVLNIKDNIKFFPLFVNWVGYTTTSVSVEHSSREEGKSSYNFSRLISLAFNVIISFSDKPLKIFVGFGAAISCLSVLVALFFAVRFFEGKITEPGFSSLILSIWFLSGVVISCIGIVGIYLGKTFNQTKNRPVFIIDEAYES